MSENEKPTEKLATPKAITERVSATLRGYAANNQLVIPADYSIENAMKAAWVILQDVTDKDGHPALTWCTEPSIARALLNMAVLGVTPAKDQCYFIVYGKKLLCQVSYFGNIAIAKRVSDTIEVYSRVVGYLRPVQQWNKGKKAEFKDRAEYLVGEAGQKK